MMRAGLLALLLMLPWAAAAERWKVTLRRDGVVAGQLGRQ